MIRKIISFDKILLSQVSFFIKGSILFSTVVIPFNGDDQVSQIYVVECLALICLSLSMITKIYRHSTSIILHFPQIFMNAILPLLITIILMALTFALTKKLKWSYMQTLLNLSNQVLFLGNIILIVQKNGKFINKYQYVTYLLTISISCVIIIAKCLWFITYEEDQLDIKNVLILSIVMYIGLSAVSIQYVQNAYYRKNKVLNTQNQLNHLQHHLETNRIQHLETNRIQQQLFPK